MQIINEIFGYPLGWVMWLCYKIVPNYIVALFIFTLITRLAMIPLSIKQQKSTIKMQLFQPRVAELQKKYKNNPQKLNEETMKLYQEEGYNPMSGCLPLLIQMPILFGVIDVVYKPLTHVLRIGSDLIDAARTIAAGVLGMDPTALAREYSSQIRILNAVNIDPSKFSLDFVNQIGNFSLTYGPFDLTMTPKGQPILSVLMLIPLLSAVTSLMSSLISMRQMKANSAGNDAAASAAGMSRGMMLMMPLMSGYFAYILPAGVGIYWIFSNLLMALQSFLLNKFMNPKEMAEKAKIEYEQKKEEERQRKIEARKLAKEQGIELDEGLSQKELNKKKLAEARKRDAEKYGDEYKEVTDDDLK